MSTQAEGHLGSPRLLILRGGAIGDFILTLPALAALRRLWPQAHIEIVGYPRVAGLALAAGIADRVVSLEQAEVAQYFSLRPSISREQAGYVRSFDLIISYLYDPSDQVRVNLLTCGARQVIYASPIVTSGHAIEHLMKPLAPLAIHPEASEYARLCMGPAHREAGRRRLEGMGADVVIIHPGSGSPRKNWPVEQFVALAERLRAGAAVQPVFSVGEADEELASELPKAAPGIPILERGDLVELASVLSACRGYVGNDSGITHLAAAVGVPAVCLFGPTDPAVWSPRGPNVRVLAAPERTTESLAAVPVDAVHATLIEAIGRAHPDPLTG